MEYRYLRNCALRITGGSRRLCWQECLKLHGERPSAGSLSHSHLVMVTPPVVPSLPQCASLLATLRASAGTSDADTPDDLAALLVRHADCVLAGTAAFRRPSTASAAALAAHGFEQQEVGDGSQQTTTKVVIGTATEQLVRELAPQLVCALARGLKFVCAHCFAASQASLWHPLSEPPNTRLCVGSAVPRTWRRRRRM